MITVAVLKAFAKINDIESEEDLDNFCHYVAELIIEVETLEEHIGLLEADVNIPLIQIN
jgi:hypothetical protein